MLESKEYQEEQLKARMSKEEMFMRKQFEAGIKYWRIANDASATPQERSLH